MLIRFKSNPKNFFILNPLDPSLILDNLIRVGILKVIIEGRNYNQFILEIDIKLFFLRIWHLNFHHKELTFMTRWIHITKTHINILGGQILLPKHLILRLNSTSSFILVLSQFLWFPNDKFRPSCPCVQMPEILSLSFDHRFLNILNFLSHYHALLSDQSHQTDWSSA